MNITFICTGNTCRSPMAEAIAMKIIAEKYPKSGITISSAGLNTFNGSPASQNSIDVCREIGIDLLEHRSRRINQEIVDNTDIFAVMTQSHADFLLRCGVPSDRVIVLGSGIPDPFGGNIEIYRECRDSLIDAVGKLLAKLTEQHNRRDESE